MGNEEANATLQVLFIFSSKSSLSSPERLSTLLYAASEAYAEAAVKIEATLPKVYDESDKYNNYKFVM